MSTVDLLLLVLVGLVFGGAILGYEFARSCSAKRVSYVALGLWPAPVRTIFTLAELGVDAGDTHLAGTRQSDESELVVLLSVDHDTRTHRLLLNCSDGSVIELDEQMNGVGSSPMHTTRWASWRVVTSPLG